MTAWCDAHAADFASSAGGSQLAWSTAHGEYQVALEEQLEDLIGRSGVDAEEAPPHRRRRVGRRRLGADRRAAQGGAAAPQAFVAYEAFEDDAPSGAGVS